eukprot:gene8888-838_t
MSEIKEVTTPNRLVKLYSMLEGKLEKSKNILIICTHLFTIKRLYSTLKDEKPNITISILDDVLLENKEFSMTNVMLATRDNFRIFSFKFNKFRFTKIYNYDDTFKQTEGNDLKFQMKKRPREMNLERLPTSDNSKTTLNLMVQKLYKVNPVYEDNENFSKKNSSGRVFSVNVYVPGTPISAHGEATNSKKEAQINAASNLLEKLKKEE